ncbi:MAG: FkbM family methyltransferase [Acidobacteria bacterium]|nr:FkbM family methyltransferase [Acidobacteriota bacterium]
MKRPLLLCVLPDRLRLAAWSRLYRGRHAGWTPLYERAELRFAPGVGLELIPGDVISDSIAFTGLYELDLTHRVVEIARRGGTMVEVVANLGYFAALWAAMSPGGRCIAFEASPRNIELLGRNMSRNGFSDRVQIVPRAAGAAAGRLHFDVGPLSQTGWGGLVNRPGGKSIDVDVVRVDEVVPLGDPIDFLKIDVEGADTWVLMGCERLLESRRVREIWFEQNKPRMAALGIPMGAAQRCLESFGYRPRAHGDPDAEIVEWSAVAG